MQAHPPVRLGGELHVLPQKGRFAEGSPAGPARGLDGAPPQHFAGREQRGVGVGLGVLRAGRRPQRNHHHEAQRLGGAVGKGPVGIGGRRLVGGLWACAKKNR